MSEIPKSDVQEQAKILVTNQDVDKKKQISKSSQKVTQINNILKIIDLPDDEEDIFEEILKTQNFDTLKNLATQPEDQILKFLDNTLKNISISEEQNITKVSIEESQKLQTLDKSINNTDSNISIENKQLTQKITKIKSTLTPSILSSNPDIAQKLNKLNPQTSIKEQQEIFTQILNILKKPWRLKAIISNLWGADKNNPEYAKFKSDLIAIDSSFSPIFDDLENLSSWVSFNPNEAIDEVETNSGGIIDIDLNSNPPVSKMSLVWSSYSFDKEINSKALSELMWSNFHKIKETKQSFALLKGVYTPFGDLLANLGLMEKISG